MRQVGDRLGRYTLLKRLAIGGMGEVFLAAKPGPVGFGPYVALKILRDELACDPQFVDMLVDEANISMFLNHQNVVSVLDLSEDDGSYYIAMEYIQGITVERLVDALAASKEALALPTTLYIAVELCRALKYAHTRVNHNGQPLNIVHRDVTPANILLSTQGEVKLTDFGIARARGRIHQTQAGVLKGKFGYMAPEMIRYERLDARADLFCAGVVMYLMMAGRHPVAGAAVMEAIQRFEQKRIPPPSHYNAAVPPVLDTIVMRALEPQPDQRWGSASALGDALRDVMLQNPEWRTHTKDGGQRLVQILRQVAPEVFQPPVPPELLQRLAGEATPDDPAAPYPRDPGAPPFAPDPGATPLAADSGPFPADPAAPFPRSGQTDAEIPTDGRLSMQEGPREANDFETDQQISVSDIRSAQQALLQEERAAVDLQERLLPNDDSSSETAENPVGEPVLVVGFPESSSDRVRQHDGLINEPALPADGPNSTTFPPVDDRTVAGFDYREEVIDRPLRTDTDRDDRTVVNSPKDEFADNDVGAAADDDVTAAPTVTAPDDPPSDKTIAGMFIPSALQGDTNSADSLPQIISTGTDDPPMTSGDDASTVIPLYGVSGETDKQAPMSALSPWPESSVASAGPAGVVSASDSGSHSGAQSGVQSGGPADATLLDGIRSRDIQAAMAVKRNHSDSLDSSEATVAGPPPDDSALDAVTIEAQPDELRSGAVDRMLSNTSWGGYRSDMGGRPEGGRPAGPSPGADSSPRMLMRPDGEVSPFEPGRAELFSASPGHPMRPPSADLPMAPAAPASPQFGDARAADPEDSTQRPPASGPPRAAGAAGSLPQVRGMAGVGMNTSRWMAGELDADALSWDDEAAARRAVATRDKPTQNAAANRYGVPGARSAGSVASTAATFWARNGALVSVMLLALALLGGLVYALMFTQMFWPRLKLSSVPPGAVVFVDNVKAPGETPLVVQVEPERRHRIEFRKDGYKRALREITEGIGRAKTYTLTVELERLPHRVILPVPGRVMLNGKMVGEGREVELKNLAGYDGGVTLRVEADGYMPYQVRFESAQEIPRSLDVALRRSSSR